MRITALLKRRVLDLTGWDFESHGPVPLNGEWEVLSAVSCLIVNDEFNRSGIFQRPGTLEPDRYDG